MLDKPKDTLQLIVHESDIPSVARGRLIPDEKKRRVQDHPSLNKKTTAHTQPLSDNSEGKSSSSRVGQVAAVTALLLFSVVTGTVGFGFVAGQQQAASPIVSVIDPVSLSTTPLGYGPQPALQQGTLYTETRESFIADQVTFIDLDLEKEQLRLFVDGILTINTPIVSAGTPGSWWETTAGLYRVTGREELLFSDFAQQSFPWTVQFQENFILHGAPTYSEGVLVEREAVLGGVEIATNEAQRVYNLVKTGTPILVQSIPKRRDAFVYEPPAPEVTATEYFVADIETGAVLASSNIDEVAPIASLTKLMTAVVAAEELQLDTRVRTSEESFVTSMIPRLSSRTSVSMYSLLQLLLAESSNEAAETIAGQMIGSTFVEAMNEKAKQLGMYNTTFTDASGLDAGNVSSVGDLYRLTQYIFENRSFIFDITRDVDLPTAYEGGDFGQLQNFNEAGNVTGFVGGKVGETSAAGQTSVSLHQLSIAGTTRTVVVVALGSEAVTADTRILVGFVESQFGS